MDTKIMKNENGKMILCADEYEMSLAKKRGYIIESNFLEYFQNKDEELKAEVKTCAEDEDGYYYENGSYDAMEVMYKANRDFDFRDYDAFYSLMNSWEGYDDAKGMSEMMKRCKVEVETMIKQMEGLKELFNTFEDLFKEIAINSEDLANELEEN